MSLDIFKNTLNKASNNWANNALFIPVAHNLIQCEEMSML